MTALATALNPTPPTPSRITKLRSDTLLLLNGERAGHMSEYAFMPERYSTDPSSGITSWKSVVQNPDFPANRELDLLRHVGFQGKIIEPLIQAAANGASIIEFGSGTPEAVKLKTVPILQAFAKARGADSIDYTALDIIPNLAASCSALVEAEVGISSQEMIRDFISDESRILLDRLPHIGLLWGGTLMNVPYYKGLDHDFSVANQMRKIGKALGVGSYLATTHYWADSQDTSHCLAPYQTDHNKKMVRSILYNIQRVLDDAFDPDLCDIEIRYNPATHTVEMGAVSRVDQVVPTPPFNGASFTIEAGRFLNLVNSVKLDPFQYDVRAQKADYRVIDSLMDTQNRQRAVLLQYRGPA